MTLESQIRKRLIALFLMGCLLFNFPFLSIFNLPGLVFGVPVLYLYLFSVWVMFIIIIILITRDRSPEHDHPLEHRA